MKAWPALLLGAGYVLAALVALLRWQAPAALAEATAHEAAPAEEPGPALERRLAAISGPPPLGRGALRAFQLDQAESGGAGLGSVEEVFPPLDFQATPQQGGILLSWVQDPRNPVEGLRYVVTRWVGEGGAEELPATTLLEFLDGVRCEGVPYHYRVRAELRRELAAGTGPSRWETRSSEPVAASCTLPRRAEWATTGEAGDGRLWLTLSRPGLPELGPFAAGPGEAIGDSGWFLEGLTLQETTLQVETKIPRFDALGRRVIINGRPADRTRLATVTPLLASLRLSDPCGASLALELLLPLDPPPSEDG